MKLEGGWNQSREHLLAGVWHLATHSTEVLEAVPDGMDVGHSHEHDLTVGVVLCRREGGGWNLRAYPGNSCAGQERSQWARFPWQGRALHDEN